MMPNVPPELDPLAPIAFDAHKLPPDIVRGVHERNALAALLLEWEREYGDTKPGDAARARLRALRTGG